MKGFICVGENLYRREQTGVYYFRGEIAKREYTRSLKTTDRSLANRKLADMRRDLGALDPTAADTLTMAGLCQSYRHTFAHQKPKTRESKEYVLRRIEDYWRLTRVADVRLNDCHVWLTWCSKHSRSWGVSLRNGHIAMLKDVFNYAVDNALLGRSPAAKLKGEKRPTPIRLTPSQEQFQAIINSVREQKFNGHDAAASADFLEFMGLAGLGQAEASALKVGDIDFKAGRIITFRHKTKTGFAIPLFPQVRPLLERLTAGRRHDAPVFKIRDAKRALSNACNRLGFPRFSQRSLRRFFVTRAIEKGIDVKTIADWQGHRDGGKLILDTYSHLRPAHSQRMALLMTPLDDEPGNIVRMPEAVS